MRNIGGWANQNVTKSSALITIVIDIWRPNILDHFSSWSKSSILLVYEPLFGWNLQTKNAAGLSWVFCSLPANTWISTIICIACFSLFHRILYVCNGASHKLNYDFNDCPVIVFTYHSFKVYLMVTYLLANISQMFYPLVCFAKCFQ